MEKQILRTSSKQERLQILKDSADKRENFTYPRALLAEEVTHLKDEFTKNAITMARHDEKRKEFLTDWKADVKPLKLEMTEQMVRIRSKVEEITEEVYLISDQPLETMGYYNASGDLVYERPLMPEEKQLSLVDKSNITGTNN